MSTAPNCAPAIMACTSTSAIATWQMIARSTSLHHVANLGSRACANLNAGKHVPPGRRRRQTVAGIPAKNPLIDHTACDGDGDGDIGASRTARCAGLSSKLAWIVRVDWGSPWQTSRWPPVNLASYMAASACR